MRKVSYNFVKTHFEINCQNETFLFWQEGNISPNP